VRYAPDRRPELHFLNQSLPCEISDSAADSWFPIRRDVQPIVDEIPRFFSFWAVLWCFGKYVQMALGVSKWVVLIVP
jgi:hypothetical protein